MAVDTSQPARLSAHAKRLIAWTIALMSGGVGLVLAVWTAVSAALGRPFSASANLVALGCAAVISLIVAGIGVLILEHRRANEAEQTIRNMRRAQEQTSINVPKGLKVGQLQRWIWEARTPDLLDESSSKLLSEMIDHCIAGLNRDTLFIIEREKSSRTFGPFEGRRGRYRRYLTWIDAKAEVTRLRDSGMIEPVPQDPTGRLRWTPFGLAVIGKLGIR